MSNTIIDVDNPGFDSNMPHHRIEDYVKVNLVFEDGEWQLDVVIRQKEALDGELTACSYDQSRDDCAICSTPAGRAAIEAADKAKMPNGHDLLEMLAVEFGYDVTRSGRADIALVTKLYEMLAEAGKVADVLAMIIAAALELDERERASRGRAWRNLLALVMRRSGKRP